MNLDQPWKIAIIVGALLCLRVVWSVWRSAPQRAAMLELLDSGLIAFVLVFVLIRPFVVQAFYIPTGSMVPTLREHDRILVNKFVYRLNEPRRGDIVVFEAPPQAHPTEDGQDFVKRLIGLPGDAIRIVHGDGVYINGERLEEPADIPRPDYDWPVDSFGMPTGGAYRVPQGCYFVLGDNRNNSRDSHLWRDSSGQPEPELKAKRVLGKAMVVFWPPSRIGLASDNRQIALQGENVPTPPGSTALADTP
jgi:signal peptidase I